MILYTLSQVHSLGKRRHGAFPSWKASPKAWRSSKSLRPQLSSSDTRCPSAAAMRATWGSNQITKNDLESGDNKCQSGPPGQLRPTNREIDKLAPNFKKCCNCLICFWILFYKFFFIFGVVGPWEYAQVMEI